MAVGCASPTRYTPVRSRRPKQNPTGGPSNRRGSGARYKQGASEPTRTLPPVSVGVSSISDSDQSSWTCYLRSDGQIVPHPESFGAHHGCGGGPILGDVFQNRAAKGQELQGAMLVGRRLQMR
jgi:hypothetical protein